MVLRDLVAHAAGAGVQEEPHRLGFVQGDFDEVVARAKAAQLQRPVSEVDGRIEPFLRGEFPQGFHPWAGGGLNRGIVAAGG